MSKAADPDPSPCHSEIKLWSRVLLMGVRDAVAEKLGHHDYDFFGVRPLEWLFNDRSYLPGSFLWICYELDLEVAAEIRAFVTGATVIDLYRLRQAAAASSLK